MARFTGTQFVGLEGPLYRESSAAGPEGSFYIEVPYLFCPYLRYLRSFQMDGVNPIMMSSRT